MESVAQLKAITSTTKKVAESPRINHTADTDSECANSVQQHYDALRIKLHQCYVSTARWAVTFFVSNVV